MDVLPKYKGLKVYTTLKKRRTKNWDAIVIGSGMAGMSCAAALARYGKKVLVLERHYLPGGFTHMFTRKGYSWDVGVHALGEMAGKAKPYKLLNWLSGKEMAMTSLGAVYDEFRFPDNFTIGFPDTVQQFKQNIIDKFPDEKMVIEKYFELCREVAKAALPYFALKTAPEWLGSAGELILGKFKRNYWQVTTTEILDEIGASKKLQSILSAQWGYYGSSPDEASFAMQALVTWHFKKGAYYPVGGSKEIAAQLMGAVIDAGGEVLCRAAVDELLVKKGRVKGVVIEGGEQLMAPVVISATAAKVTVNKIVPKDYRKSSWVDPINKIGNSPSYICLNMGFEGDIKAAGASSTNLWLNSTWDMNHKLWDIGDEKAIAPILYVSFPSLKDPLHEPGENMMNTGECITFVPYDAFLKWKNSTSKRRDAEYNEFKKHIEDRLIKMLEERIPKIMSHMTFKELSTPLTAEHFVNAVNGSIYGLESTPERFNCKQLRARTPIKGFFMTGVDTLTTGVTGAMSSGVLTAACIEPKVYSKFL